MEMVEAATVLTEDFHGSIAIYGDFQVLDHVSFRLV
jgi:hypothetical protein